jgi:hypothetical protein
MKNIRKALTNCTSIIEKGAGVNPSCMSRELVLRGVYGLHTIETILTEAADPEMKQTIAWLEDKYSKTEETLLEVCKKVMGFTDQYFSGDMTFSKAGRLMLDIQAIVGPVLDYLGPEQGKPASPKESPDVIKDALLKLAGIGVPPHCPHCGNEEISPGAKFCKKCGKALKEAV